MNYTSSSNCQRESCNSDRQQVSDCIVSAVQSMRIDQPFRQRRTIVSAFSFACAQRWRVVNWLAQPCKTKTNKATLNETHNRCNCHLALARNECRSRSIPHTHTHTIYSFKANKSSVVFVLSQTNFNILTVERTEVAAKHLFFDESTTLFNVLLLTYSQSNAFAFDTAPRLIWQIQTNSSSEIRSIYAMKKSQRWILPEESGSCRECCWFRFEFNEKSSSTEGILFNAL